MASKTSNAATSEPFAPATCPLKRAWEVAFGPGVRTDVRAYATLGFNAKLRGPSRVVSTGAESLLVDATTCVLISSLSR